MEQSSLSLASSINDYGVYHIGWSDENTEKVRGQSSIKQYVKNKINATNISRYFEMFLRDFHSFAEMSRKHGEGDSETGRRGEELQT